MGLSQIVYNSLFKRTSTFVLTIAVGAFAFERGNNLLFYPSWRQNLYFCMFLVIDEGVDYLWETNNKGKLWKDIKHKYQDAPEE